jgi:hypothetical protein
MNRSDQDTLERLRNWHQFSADEMRLRCGELTASEIRSIRAVLNTIVGKQHMAKGQREMTKRQREWERGRKAFVDNEMNRDHEIRDAELERCARTMQIEERHKAACRRIHAKYDKAQKRLL